MKWNNRFFFVYKEFLTRDTGIMTKGPFFRPSLPGSVQNVFTEQDGKGGAVRVKFLIVVQFLLLFIEDGFNGWKWKY